MAAAGTVRMAIVGMGIGKANGLALAANPRCRVVALCDLVEDRMAEFAAELPGEQEFFIDYKQMCRDRSIDAIFVGTPNQLHVPIAVEAVRRDKHVLVTKPLADAERAAKKLGYTPYPAPVAILSQPHNGRPGCIHCGFCNGYGCEVNAKSSTAVTMLPLALASGNCELRTECTVSRINTNAVGRVTEVVYWEADGTEVAQRANAVVLSANGAETPRLLLMSATGSFPDGLANSSGMVGKNLMFNGYTQVIGLFDEPIHAYKSVPVTRVVHDFWTLDESLGFYGGGGIDSRHPYGGNLIAAGLGGGLFGGPSWGSDYKRSLRQLFTHSCSFDGHTTSLPLASNNVTLDPNVQDMWGRPAIRVTYMDHADDFATMKYILERSMELMDAAGAIRKLGSYNENGSVWTQHLLGTCRMGNDPGTSVVDKFNRAHDIPNLFMVDGSSMVSSSRGQPTMTIMALAFRAADYIIQAARRSEI